MNPDERLGVWVCTKEAKPKVWRVIYTNQERTKLASEERDRVFTTCTVRRLVVNIDHYFTNPSCPTEKELLMLSLLEPEIHRQIVKILEEN